MPFSTADPNAFVALGMQSALGTPQTTATKLRYAKFLSGSDFAVMIDKVDLREGGDGLDVGFTYKRLEKVEGQLVVNARGEIAGQLLELLPGGATWDGASSPALHTFHSGHASFPWASIFVQHPGSSIPLMLSNVRLKGFTLEMSSGEPWKLTFPFLAITHGASFAALTPTYYFDDPILFHGNPTYVIDGTADTAITDVTITHSLDVNELQSQAISLDEAPVMKRDTDITIVRRYEAPTLWQKIYYNGGVQATNVIATGSLRVGARADAAGTRQLDAFVNLLTYGGNVLTSIDPDGKTVVETITAQALKGATHALIMQLKNGHASAYAS
jgi:hypothetical protein